MKSIIRFAGFLFITLFIIPTESNAQHWIQDFRNMLEIDDVVTIESSPSHLYILSGEEGLVVFRTEPDTLQWLYSSTGMQRRGHTLQADVRFAYLYGDSRRLTIVEPTSVLGVYSATVLPERPQSVARVGGSIYIALGEQGVGRLSLESPESVDTDPEFPFSQTIENNPVLDLTSDLVSSLYILAGNERLDIYKRGDTGEEMQHDRTVSINRPTHKLFLTEDELIGANRSGDIFYIDSEGRTDLITSIGSPIDKVEIWQDRLVARTEEGELWIGKLDDTINLWKESTGAGNYFAVANDRLWVSDFNQISPILRVSDEESTRRAESRQAPKIKPLQDITIPFPRPLILPIEMESTHPPNDLELSYRSNLHNATLRGNTFFWQPTATQIGRHNLTIVATTSGGQTDSTRLTVNVRPFNAPPRFSPMRPITINKGEEFTVDINAVDPDGMDQELIRYLGVDMPEGASLDETTGTFSWTPNIRQVGEHQFQVIATDQYGAASQQEIIINVIETDPDAEAEINESID